MHLNTVFVFKITRGRVNDFSEVYYKFSDKRFNNVNKNAEKRFFVEIPTEE